MAKKSQIDKFREAARVVETDDDEGRFNDALRKVAKAKPKPLDPDKLKKAVDDGDTDAIACELGQTEDDVWHREK